MAKSTAKKSTSVKKTSRSAKKMATTAKKPAKKTTQKVDFYPNRMTVAISALAGTLLVLITIIAVLGSRG